MGFRSWIVRGKYGRKQRRDWAICVRFKSPGRQGGIGLFVRDPRVFVVQLLTWFGEPPGWESCPMLEVVLGFRWLLGLRACDFSSHLISSFLTHLSPFLSPTREINKIKNSVSELRVCIHNMK